jgi:hypothetical protein
MERSDNAHGNLAYNTLDQQRVIRAVLIATDIAIII